MAKAKQDQTLFEGLLNASLYKRNQGKLTRQATAAGIAAIVLLGAWTLSGPLSSAAAGQTDDVRNLIRYGIPAVIGVLGCWFAFRVVNYPRFADFLISVQAEMDKVSWASKDELKRSTVVVIAMMFFLAAALFAYDLFWIWLFRTLTILQPEAAGDPAAVGAG